MHSACAEYDVLRNKNRLLEQESNSLFLYDLCQTVYPSPRICWQVSGRAVRVPDSPYTNISPHITQKEKPLTSVSGLRLVEN